ncbi:MAG: hypothetical protein MSA55_00035 [Coriobacteriaceae bacterium]|nr:hypothetical protein [Coriobacteriaceae bacterium]MDY3799037.1 hypothetical protein [Eggerthellaceae bacterium]MDD6636916.1 hypothetical protein [Coriobacteriaceae bacterium]MDD7431415.1 hypothetical protein [Coriobacteriaceae bacterium]MDO4498183.1 hypothetical protein [Coriobacteriaceae bacterium]
MSLLEVRAIRVLSDRMVFNVCFPEERFRLTDGAIAARAAALRPNLPEHACVNPKGNRFRAVMGCTSMPHLLEHCIIDFLVEEAAGPSDSFQGTSRWTDREAGFATIQISMKDDLAVLRAFKRAVRFLEEEVIS